MSFEPQKFFIGLMDFFTILLPGAFLTFFLRLSIDSVIFEERSKTFSETSRGIAFLVASYLIGHFIFLVSSWLDEFYDWLRRYTLNSQIFILAHRGTILWLPLRWLIRILFKRERNVAVGLATKLKRKALSELGAENSVNTFQWCKAWLTKESPESLAAIQRFEADSKFFRCFVLVLLILVTLWIYNGNVAPALVGIGLLPLALWRYMEQRLKATNQAYLSVITLIARSGLIKLDKKASDFTHAGGIVFRKHRKGIQYLLVEAKKNPSEWVLPKGHIEEGESLNETAVREVHEETGKWAKVSVDAHLKPVSYSLNGEEVCVKFFLMKYRAWGLRTDADRKSRWFSFHEAVEKLQHKDLKDRLRSAEKQRSKIADG